MKKLKNIHPGEILKEEFLLPLGISAYRLSKDISIRKPVFHKLLKETAALQPTRHFVYQSILATLQNSG